MLFPTLPGNLLLIIQDPAQGLSSMKLPLMSLDVSPLFPLLWIHFLVTVLMAVAIWAPECLPHQAGNPSREGLTHLTVPNRTHGLNEHRWPRGLAFPPPGLCLCSSPTGSDLFLLH